MKKILIISLMILATTSASSAQETWPAFSAKQAEYNRIMLQIAELTNNFTAMSGGARLSSPCYKSMVVQLLQQIGTPVSYKIYQEMLTSKQL
ncbi:MAG: hypothetical protein P4L31_00805 [Candidatus Babeliales bacterium]|nr:hypothetical protein [Candidatus Babeliales bacterium]